MRTIIDLPDSQIEILAKLCEREGISRAEAVRRAVASMLKESSRKSGKGFREAVAQWQKAGIHLGDGVDYQRRLRAEWED